MTNQEAKHKAIQEAYGEYWEDIKQFFDPSYEGFIFKHDVKFIKPCIGDFFVTKGNWIIPKSIWGIENNNGWVRIEPDGSNLPTDETKKYIAGKLENKVFKKCRSALEAGELSEYHTSMQVTHYQVEEIPNPIY